jgi:hypothetical protein
VFEKKDARAKKQEARNRNQESRTEIMGTRTESQLPWLYSIDYGLFAHHK